MRTASCSAPLSGRLVARRMARREGKKGQPTKAQLWFVAAAHQEKLYCACVRNFGTSYGSGYAVFVESPDLRLLTGSNPVLYCAGMG